MDRKQDLQTSQYANTTSWDMDGAHSALTFSVKHLMFATVRGKFSDFQSVIHLDEDDPTQSVVEARIDAASIDTGLQDRDDHLRSEDFLHAEAHPQLVFKSTHIEPTGDDRALVQGDLTIRGTTRPVQLEVTREGVGTDPWGNTRSAYTATTTIDRREYGLSWNQALETGGIMVGNKVQIQIEVQAVKRAATE